MSKARLIITAVVLEGRTQADVAATYGVSKGWVSKLVARYKAEGETAFEPRSRRPKSTPNATPAATVELIWSCAASCQRRPGRRPRHDQWHLAQDHDMTVSRATISRHLAKAGLVVPEPKKRPKSSYIRFQAADAKRDLAVRLHPLPARRRHYTEILTWLDDCTRTASTSPPTADHHAHRAGQFRKAIKTSTAFQPQR